MKVVILGGGISGRLARYVFGCGTVLERGSDKKSLTRMFGTNYLWEPLDGLHCTEFEVVTTVDGLPPEASRIARYKRKIGKPEDIGNWGLQFEHRTTGYDLYVPQVPVVFDADVREVDLDRRLVRAVTPHHDGEVTHRYPFDVLINTLPLDVFCKLAGLGRLFAVGTAFRSHAIFVQVRKFDEVVRAHNLAKGNRMLVNYVSDPLIPHYRECLRDGMWHTEFLAQPSGNSVCIKPGKIKPSPLVTEILEHLRSNRVHCFGRFARWEPNELVHQTFRQLKEVDLGSLCSSRHPV